AAKASGNFSPAARYTNGTSASPNAYSATSRDVSYRVAPEIRTVSPAIEDSSKKVSALTDAVPPTTTILSGANRAISSAMTSGTISGRTSNNGPPSWAAAGPADSASGKFSPFVMYTTSAVPGYAACAMFTATS